MGSIDASVGRRYDASDTTNYPEITNISPEPNEELVGRVIAAYDRFYASISRLHAPHVIELSLTLAQLKALYLVASSGPMRMSAVAQRLGTAASTTSEVVHGLVQLGLLERVEDPADRRQVLVRPTPAAAERLEDFSELGHHRVRDLLAHVQSPDDLVVIRRALELLADAAATAERNPT